MQRWEPVPRAAEEGSLRAQLVGGSWDAGSGNVPNTRGGGNKAPHWGLEAWGSQWWIKLLCLQEESEGALGIILRTQRGTLLGQGHSESGMGSGMGVPPPRAWNQPFPAPLRRMGLGK